MLPLEPFRRWLVGVVDRVGSCEAAEPVVDLPVRTIRRFVKPTGAARHQSQVSLDIVDHALTHEGTTPLWELYPRLYWDEFV